MESSEPFATGADFAADDSNGTQVPPGRSSRPRVFGRYALAITVLPFLVWYLGVLLAGYLEGLRADEWKKLHPTAETIFDSRSNDADNDGEKTDKDAGETAETHPSAGHSDMPSWMPLDKKWYPTLYSIAIGLSILTILAVSPGYRKIPFRVSWLSFFVGTVGVFIWVGLCLLDEKYLGLGARFGSRQAFNPFEELKDTPQWMYQFLAIRFTGLVLVVPIVEEFFLRGWLMRYADDLDWDEIPIGEAGYIGISAAIIYGVLSHPTDFLAALAWFSLMTWMFLRTKSIWDCVVAHMITNLLLGIYIVKTGHWSLW